MIADKLRYYRAINNLTQMDLALCAGVRPSVIGQIEARNGDAYISTAIKIANALNVRLDDLIRPISEEEFSKMKRLNEMRVSEKEKIRLAKNRLYKARHRARLKSGNARQANQHTANPSY